MQTSRPSFGALRLLLEIGAYHLAQLTADPQVEELAAGFGGAQSRLRTVAMNVWSAREARAIAKARRDRMRTALHEAVREFTFVLLRSCGHYRMASAFVRYFPAGVGGALNGSIRGVLLKMAVIKVHFESEENPVIRAHAEPLGTAIEDLRSANAAYDDAVLAVKQVEGIEKSERIDWVDLYKRDFHLLSERFGTKVANRYFVRFAARRRAGHGATNPDGGTEGVSGSDQGGTVVGAGPGNGTGVVVGSGVGTRNGTGTVADVAMELALGTGLALETKLAQADSHAEDLRSGS